MTKPTKKLIGAAMLVVPLAVVPYLLGGWIALSCVLGALGGVAWLIVASCLIGDDEKGGW